MSKIDRHSAVTPSPKEQRILMRALGCGVEELVARLGQENAIKRVETELRRAKRARSRKLHTFWSAVLVTIDTDTDERRNTKSAGSARHMPTPGNDARDVRRPFRPPPLEPAADEHTPSGRQPSPRPMTSGEPRL
jgi:hypothetical protein